MRQFGGVLTTLILRHIAQFGGKVWYVNANTGSDSNSGYDATVPFATINAALSVADSGDAINIKAGTYNESVDLNQVGLELWCEIGVVLGSSGTVLTLSGNYCKVIGGTINQPGQVGIHVTGSGCQLWSVIVTAATTAFDIDGSGNVIVEGIASGYTVTGIDIATASNLLSKTACVGSGGATRGYYLSNSAADYNVIREAQSIGNATAGYELVTTASYNLIADAVTGGGDGAPIDAGAYNVLNITGIAIEEVYHEHTYPVSDGEGSVGDPVTVSSNAGDETHGGATTINYWGEPTILVPVNTFTSIWYWVGMYIFGTTTGKSLRSIAYKICSSVSTTRNGGNAWLEGETSLTVTDGSIFQVSDLVWIVSDYVQADGEGEFQKITNIAGNVITIAREGSQFGVPNTGLRWNHTTNEKMYLAYRVSDTESHGYDFDFACASGKVLNRYDWANAKRMTSNCGVIVRTQNATDSTNNTRYDCSIIYRE